MSIPLIAEGNEAELHLGVTFITQEAISGRYADVFALIGRSLSAEADLLVYGCNFGKGEDGAQAIESLANMTGANLAVSSDRTGHSMEYGNWEKYFSLVTSTTNSTQTPINSSFEK